MKEFCNVCGVKEIEVSLMKWLIGFNICEKCKHDRNTTNRS